MTRRPVGAAILAVIALVGGVTDVLVGLQLTGVVVFGRETFGSGVLAWGILAVLVGAAWIAAAFAFWATKPWAWLVGMLVAIFGLLNAMLVLLGAGSLQDGIAAAIMPLVVLWYLQQDHVKHAFGYDEAT